eukprot:gnl/Dysnectes_brevis/2890_a3531_1270.p1 GENE.gnl/Dysnectes_brevis/2890_a3531_1270~~gnl/Dysnectes_brevis/2890_a3531_1270.p1  ORF type:complete len:393 (+),score=138.35 gnl/Dysnectes_brevis/2890_a3531_1270:33-1181(+)
MADADALKDVGDFITSVAKKDQKIRESKPSEVDLPPVRGSTAAKAEDKPKNEASKKTVSKKKTKKRRKKKQVELPIDPTTSEDFRLHGNACFKDKNYKGAIKHYSRAVSLDPTSDAAVANRGLCYFKLGKNQEAIEDCTAALAINVDYAKVYVRRGRAYKELTQYDLALQDFSAALQLLKPEQKEEVETELALLRELMPQDPDVVMTSPDGEGEGMRIMIEEESSSEEPKPEEPKPEEPKPEEPKPEESKPEEHISVPPPPVSAFVFNQDVRLLAPHAAALASYLASFHSGLFSRYLSSEFDHTMMEGILHALSTQHMSPKKTLNLLFSSTKAPRFSLIQPCMSAEARQWLEDTRSYCESVASSSEKMTSRYGTIMEKFGLK